MALRGRGGGQAGAGRRAPLPSVALGLLLSWLGGCGGSGPDETAPTPSPVVKHFLLFIADGMHLENEIATSRYLHGTDRGLAWHAFPTTAHVTTWDVTAYDAYASDAGALPYAEGTFDWLLGYDPSRGGSAPYPEVRTGDRAYLFRAATDSASSATALATGEKTDAGNIAWRRGDPVDGALVTLPERLRARRGSAIGVVTNVPVSHATPAAFVSHNPSRGNTYAITEEILRETLPEVVIGGGHPSWHPGYVTQGQLDGLRTSAEYLLVERLRGEEGGARLLAAADALPGGRRLFGLFGGPGGNFEPPLPRDDPGAPGFAVEAENPSLADATVAALRALARHPAGFFLMVEGGDVDWANHAQDFAWSVGAVASLDRAVSEAVAFVDRPGDGVDWTNTLLVVTCDHATGALRLSDALPLGAGDLPRQEGNAYPDGEVAFGTGGHTNELVTLYAIGARRDLFESLAGRRDPGTRILDNTEVHRVLAEAAGLTP